MSGIYLSPFQVLKGINLKHGLIVKYATGQSAYIQRSGGQYVAVPLAEGIEYGEQQWLGHPDAQGVRPLLTFDGWPTRLVAGSDQEANLVKGRKGQPFQLPSSPKIYSGGRILAVAPIEPVVGCALTQQGGRWWVLAICYDGLVLPELSHTLYAIPLEHALTNAGAALAGGGTGFGGAYSGTGLFDGPAVPHDALWRRMWQGSAPLLATPGAFVTGQPTNRTLTPWHFNASGTAAVMTTRGTDGVLGYGNHHRSFRLIFDPITTVWALDTPAPVVSPLTERLQVTVEEQTSVANDITTGWANISYKSLQRKTGGDWRARESGALTHFCGDYLGDQYVEWNASYFSEPSEASFIQFEHLRPTYLVLEATAAPVAGVCPIGFIASLDAPAGNPICVKTHAEYTTKIGFSQFDDALTADLVHTLYPPFRWQTFRQIESYTATFTKDSPDPERMVLASTPGEQHYENGGGAWSIYNDARLGVHVVLSEPDQDLWPITYAKVDDATIRRSTAAPRTPRLKAWYKGALLVDIPADGAVLDTSPNSFKLDIAPSTPVVTDIPLHGGEISSGALGASQAGTTVSAALTWWDSISAPPSGFAAGFVTNGEMMVFYPVRSGSVGGGWNVVPLSSLNLVYRVDASLDVVEGPLNLRAIIDANLSNFAPGYWDAVQGSTVVSQLVVV